MSGTSGGGSISVRAVGLALVANGLLIALASAMTHTFETAVDRMPFTEKLYSWLAYSVILFVVAFGVLYAALRTGDPLVQG